MTRTRADGPGDKQRRFPRAASINTVLVTAVDGVPLDHFLKTHSVGRGGCGFSSDLALEVDAVLDLMIALRSVAAFKVTARVAYCYRDDDGQYEVGCEFLDLAESEQQLIDELVRSYRSEGRPGSEGTTSAGNTAPVG